MGGAWSFIWAHKWLATGAAGLASSPDAVRDNGLTLFGSGALGSKGTSNLKYYAGIYNGIQAGVEVLLRQTDAYPLQAVLQAGPVIGHRLLGAGGITRVEAGHGL